MFDILLSASAYALIIVVGAVCSHTGFIKSETKNVFSRLLFNITLPCTVVYSFVGFQFDASLLLVSAVSFAATVVGFGGAYAIVRTCRAKGVELGTKTLTYGVDLSALRTE